MRYLITTERIFSVIIIILLILTLVSIGIDRSPEVPTPPEFIYLEKTVFDVAGEDTDLTVLSFLKVSTGEVIEIPIKSEKAIDAVFSAYTWKGGK